MQRGRWGKRQNRKNETDNENQPTHLFIPANGGSTFEEGEIASVITPHKQYASSDCSCSSGLLVFLLQPLALQPVVSSGCCLSSKLLLRPAASSRCWSSPGCSVCTASPATAGLATSGFFWLLSLLWAAPAASRFFAMLVLTKAIRRRSFFWGGLGGVAFPGIITKRFGKSEYGI